MCVFASAIGNTLEDVKSPPRLKIGEGLGGGGRTVLQKTPLAISLKFNFSEKASS